MNISGPKPATLTGLAVGAALGMPFEGMAAYSSPLLSWKGFFQDSLDDRPKNLKAGEWTGDARLAQALAVSLLESDTYSPADAAAKYLACYESQDLRGLESSTSQAIRRLKVGFPWTQSGKGDSEWGGPAMRVAPLGLLFWRNIQAAAEMARIDARVTHKSEEAELGSVAVATAVALLVEGRVAKQDLILKVLEWVPAPSQMHFRLRAAANLAPRGRATQGENDRSFVETLTEMGTGPHASQTVPAAICAFVGSTSFEDAVVTAIRAGGSTDTIGAITGALAGTYYGIGQVARYVDKVADGELLRGLEAKLIAASKPITGKP